MIQITTEGTVADVRLEEYKKKRENWYNGMIKNQKGIWEIKRIMEERDKWRAGFADYMAHYRRN
ncbi:MAG: hypothetical protein AABW91_01025 [Nanoarchaeota archaeon]